MRCVIAILGLSVALGAHASTMPFSDVMRNAGPAMIDDSRPDSAMDLANVADLNLPVEIADDPPAVTPVEHAKPAAEVPTDANGKPIPLEMQQPKRILGFMPNFRSVSGGSTPHPPGWKYNFKVATDQSTDYSSFVFLSMTSLTAEGMNLHPALGKGVSGAWAYSWRGFLDKTDNTYPFGMVAVFGPRMKTRASTHWDAHHSIPIRELYVISRQGVARTYGGRQTPNVAGLGAKVLTQVVSREYYPSSATTFQVLATKFAYSAMREYCDYLDPRVLSVTLPRT